MERKLTDSAPPENFLEFLVFVFSYNLRAKRPIWGTVTICHRIPFENSRFINMSAAILMYFVNTTLNFFAIKDGNQIRLKRSSVKVMLCSSRFPVTCYGQFKRN